MLQNKAKPTQLIASINYVSQRSDKMYISDHQLPRAQQMANKIGEDRFDTISCIL